MSEVLSRISSLEGSLNREEKLRLEMRDKLRVSEEQNRELANFIKSLQTQSDQELTQMRTFLQDKLNEDHINGKHHHNIFLNFLKVSSIKRSQLSSSMKLSVSGKNMKNKLNTCRTWIQIMSQGFKLWKEGWLPLRVRRWPMKRGAISPKI